MSTPMGDARGPRGFSATTTGDRDIRLAWSATEPGADRYELWVAYTPLGEDPVTDFTLLATLPVTHPVPAQDPDYRDTGGGVYVRFVYQRLTYLHADQQYGTFAYKVRGVVLDEDVEPPTRTDGAFSEVLTVVLADTTAYDPGDLSTGAQDLTYVEPQRYWRFQTLDASETYTFERNPTTAANVFAQRELTFSTSPVEVSGQRFTAARSLRLPVQWQFAGSYRTESQRDAFEYWLGKKEKIRVITDLGEVHLARLISFEPESTGGRRNQFHQSYTMHALVYDEVRP